MSATKTYHSVLLMESHGLTPDVRSTSFSSVKVWSKLYQAGPYFVDLMLRPGDRSLDLHGELIAKNGAPAPDQIVVTLRDRQGTASTVSAYNGTFTLELTALGNYRLDLTFGRERVLLSDIEVR